MFPRIKVSGKYRYLQIVENRRINGTHKQQVIASLGRMDELSASGQLDELTCRLAKLCNDVQVVSAHRAGSIQSKGVKRIGPALVFERLWEAMGIDRVLKRLLGGRKFGFEVERAIFVTVLHRLFASGSDRAAEKWWEDYRIAGVEDLSLHQLYRAMGWLGEALAQDEQSGATPFAPRCTKDLAEEALFARRQDLFTNLDVVFFDTTSIYFEGEGGDTLGRRGKSKDHRPDLQQMVVGAVLDGAGRPVCCELWPGNTTDVTTLVPIVERLRERFHVGAVCVVADRGMISAKTIEALESTPGLTYILGARMRRQKEVNTDVLSRAGRYHEVYPKRKDPQAPSPLKVKEVFVEDRRYIVCHNEDQARKDAADREAILAHLAQQLQQGDKSLVGNQGYRKYLTATGPGFAIDAAKVQAETRLDGKWVLRTNTVLSAQDTALKYKQLWMVENLFRTTKSILETRPIYHKCDETIRGHVFCSFLALVLKTELYERLEGKGRPYEWDDIRRDLEALQETELALDDKTYFVRTEFRGTCHDVLRAAGVAPPPTLR